MPEPAERDAAVGGLVLCQLPHHLRLGAGVRQHVDEVQHHHVQVVPFQGVELCQQLVGRGGVVYLVVAEGVLAAVTVQLGLYERCLVQVLALVLVLVHPQVGKHLGYLVGHQSREDGVTRILGGGGQYAAVDVLIDDEHVGQLGAQRAPLVVAEVVEHDETYLLSLVQAGEHPGLEDVGAHQRTSLGVRYPVGIVLLHELGKGLVGLRLLHTYHLVHVAVCLRQLQLPEHQTLVHLLPVLKG